MTQTIAYLALLVRDYDEALAYFTHVLGFENIEDTVLSNGKRWVLIAPRNSHATRLLLAQAVGPEQVRQIGNQAAGRVFLFLHTDDFWHDYSVMRVAESSSKKCLEKSLMALLQFLRTCMAIAGTAKRQQWTMKNRDALFALIYVQLRELLKRATRFLRVNVCTTLFNYAIR